MFFTELVISRSDRNGNKRQIFKGNLSSEVNVCCTVKTGPSRVDALPKAATIFDLGFVPPFSDGSCDSIVERYTR